MKHSISSLSVILMAGGACWYAAAVSQPAPPTVAPSSLVPKDSVLFVQFDGVNAHMPAIKETAQWQAFDDSGLRERVFDILEMLASTGGPDAARLARTALDSLHQHGMSLGIAMTAADDPVGLSPYGVLVFHGAGDLKHDLISMLFELDDSMRRNIETRTKAGRQISVAIPPNAPMPGLEVALWTEGEHLVLAAGVNASDRVIATLQGSAPNITEHPLYGTIRAEQDFTVSQLGWIDIQAMLGSLEVLPLPPLPNGEQMDLREILAVLGLANLEAVTMGSGHRGNATWDQFQVIAPEPRTGILALMNQRHMTLSELPPLPPTTDAFLAATFDIRNAVDTILETTRNGLALVEPQGVAQFDQGLEQFTQMLGEPRDVLSSGLGDVFCLYSEPGMLPFGFSPVLTASVRDRQVLTGSLDMLSQMLQSVPDLEEVTIRKQKKDYGTVYTIVVPNIPLIPTILVSDDWFLVSLTPGAAQALVKRQAGDLPSWSPSAEHQEAMADLPASFSSLMVMDPRPGYTQLMSFVPMGLALLETTLLPALSKESGVPLSMPFDTDDMPIPDQITGPLFPNVSVGFANSAGSSSLSRSSVPVMPVGGVGSTAVVPVLVALLLPAVQQAREAARRTQSRNNLKQIGLAMHNSHDVYGSFPSGTVQNENLDPEQRLGWAVSILPYIEEANTYNRIEMAAGWEDQDDFVTAAVIPSYLNPSMSRFGESGGQIDYLGVAGIGPDAATLENNDPNTGIFGYDRQTRLRDITDGTSNTVMVADSAEPNAYIQGYLTISGFSEEPYIGGPDGFGAVHSGGMNSLFADGSVRFISEFVDPTVIEAVATKGGGEVVGDF